MTGLLLCNDFFFTSKVTGTADALGVTVHEAGTQQGALRLVDAEHPRFVIIDLGTPGLQLAELLDALPADDYPRVIAFDSHVNTERMQSAREAGCDQVLPKSRFSAELPELLQRMTCEDE